MSSSEKISSDKIGHPLSSSSRKTSEKINEAKKVQCVRKNQRAVCAKVAASAAMGYSEWIVQRYWRRVAVEEDSRCLSRKCHSSHREESDGNRTAFVDSYQCCRMCTEAEERRFSVSASRDCVTPWQIAVVGQRRSELRSDCFRRTTRKGWHVELG